MKLRLPQIAKDLVSSLRARVAKHYVTKELVATLKVAHAVELAETPGELHPQIRAKHALQIEAVRAGKLDIVDRRSWAFPYLPSTLTRLQQPIIKMVPYNLRRFAKTPVPRRAINLIKNAITSLDWDIIPIDNVTLTSDADQATRIAAAKNSFKHPNNTQSMQELLETGIDDFCIMGAMVIEPQITPDPERPIKMWNVDASTIRFYPNWMESQPDLPRYAQMTGLKGERGIVPFYEDELMYIKDNPSVETPFGTGKMEVAFQSITHFLGVQEMSGKAGADQVHKTWLWWQEGTTEDKLSIIRRHITNDLEGQAKISLMAGMKAPEVIDVTTVTNEDILLPWQELLIRIICLAFDMSAMKFLERDVNRSTGEVLSDDDFRSAVVPTAVRIAEHFTRFILHKKLGWNDLEFKFLNLDDPDLLTKVDMLSKIYSMNAITPNQICEELGRPKLPSKFADLTQFEAILVNTQASASIQDANAKKASDRAFDQQTQQMQMYQEMAQEQGDQGGEQQASAATSSPKAPKGPTVGGKMKLPTLKPPRLPQMPIAGSIYNAQQIAAMSLGELKAAMKSGNVPQDPDKLKQGMQTQDPNILMQMEPGIVEYLDSLKKEQDKEKAKSKVKITDQVKKDQLQRYKKAQHKPSDIERKLYPNALSPRDLTPELRSVMPAFQDKRRVKATPGIKVTQNRGLGKEVSTTDVNKARKLRRKGR